jgi:hypothetical protein
MSTIDTTAILQGPCDVYVGAFGATEPVAGTFTEPSSAIWTPVGATSGGVKLASAMTYKSIDVDQVPDEVGVRLTGRSSTVETQLAESTLANMKFLMNGGTITVGGASSIGTVTIVAATGVMTVSVTHGLAVNDPVFLGAITSTTGVLANTLYYVKTVPSTTTLTLSRTPGGTALTLATDGSAASITKATYQQFEPLSSTDAFQPTYSALLLAGPAPGMVASYRRFVVVRKVLSTSGFELTWKKDDPSTLTAKFGAYYVSDSIKPIRIIDQLS